MRAGLLRAERAALLHVGDNILTLLHHADIPHLQGRGLIERRMGAWNVTNDGKSEIDAETLEGWRLFTSAWRRR